MPYAKITHYWANGESVELVVGTSTGNAYPDELAEIRANVVALYRVTCQAEPERERLDGE